MRAARCPRTRYVCDESDSRPIPFDEMPSHDPDVAAATHRNPWARAPLTRDILVPVVPASG